MSARLLGLVAICVGVLMTAACGSDGALLQDADSVPLPRPKVSPVAFRSPPPTLPELRHLPEPVSAQQFNEDRAKCTKVANAAPGVGSPEIKFYLAFRNCMHAEGYEASL